MNKRPVLLGAVLAAVAAFAVWQTGDLASFGAHRGREVAGTDAPATAPAPAPAASGAAPAASGSVAQAPSEPVEQVGENNDSATVLQEILPRQSIAHERGLNKVKDTLGLHSSAAIVMDAETGKVEFAKNEGEVLPMASITKLMTAVVTLEANLPMEAPITITEDDMDKERHSRSRLKVGTVLSRAEALHLALMSSENRAAHALGRTYPGGLPRFVEAMNHKAKQLGMAHTTYVDPTGLSASNQTTAADLATLARAASKYETIRQYSTDESYLTRVGNRSLQYLNSNRLVRGGGWDIELQKTGYIIEAGHCVVMQTKMAGREMVMVLLDADSNNRRNADAERIRAWTYKQAGVPDERRFAKAKPAVKEDRKVAKAVAPKDDGKHARKEDAKPSKQAKSKSAKDDDAKDTKSAKAPKAGQGKDETKVAAKAKPGERVRKSFAPSDDKVAAKKKDEHGS